MKNTGFGQMTTESDQLIPIEEVPTFYMVAYSSFLQVRRLVNGRVRHERAVAREGREWTEDDLDFLTLNKLTPADEERLAFVTVIFSALALEALINDYAICNFSRSYLENYSDRLSPRSKWLIFPKLVAGKAMSTDGQTFQRLTELFRLRDRLVHFKGSPEKRAPDLGQKDRITRKHATDAIRTVTEAVAELKRLDERISMLWLAESEETVAE